MTGSLAVDLRAVARSLARRPGYTIASVVTIALAIAANGTVFGVVDAVLFKALPFPDPHRLVLIWETIPAQGEASGFLSFPTFRDYGEGAGAFEDMAAFFAHPNQDVNLTGGTEPERVNVARVTYSYFDVLGVAPELGRAFTEEEDHEGNHRVAILSHSLWRRQFGADPSVVGQSVHVNGFPYVVVGVMPADFRPVGSLALGEEVEMWRPLAASVQQRTTREWRDLRVVGRLAPGATVEAAQRELSAVSERIARDEPSAHAGRGVRLVTLREQSVGDVRSSLVLLWAAVGLVLLVACANVANLQLVQVGARVREVSIRASLGATRRRVARLLLLESGALAFTGAAVGLILAWIGVDLVVMLAGEQTPLLERAAIDGRVIGFTVLVACGTALLFGAAPALGASRLDLTAALKAGGAGPVAGGWSGSRLFVVAQLVLTMVLLVGSGLLLRSFSNLRSVDPGFEPDGIVTFQLELPMVTKYPSQEGRERFFEELRGRLGALPGVVSVANASSVPMGDRGISSSFRIEGRPEPDPADRPVADMRLVSLGYFSTMGIPLLHGRAHDERDLAGAPRVVVVNRTLADRLFVTEDAIGAEIRVDGGSRTATIVGVVGDVRLAGLAEAPRPAIYYAADQVAYNFMAVVVRTAGRPGATLPAVRAEVTAIDPELPLHNVRTASELLERSVRADAFTARLLSAFAAIALVLAGVGTYGVMASAVDGRRREMGIRAALGARPSDTFWSIVLDGARMVVAGVALGVLLAVALCGTLSNALYAVSPLDPATYAVTATFLSLIGLTTVAGTAIRGATADPMEALGTE